MQSRALIPFIQNKRLAGATYQKIASELGICKALVKYIETHPNYRPGPRIAAILHLEPSNELQYTRRRNATMDAIARMWGYQGASHFWRCMIELYGKDVMECVKS